MKKLWEIVHNLVAHPLLITGFNWADRFHDWTARKFIPRPNIFAVSIYYKIVSHPTDLEEIMSPDEVCFIGTEDECKDFLINKLTDWALDLEDRISDVLCHATGSNLSKVNYTKEVMREQIDEYQQKCYYGVVKSDVLNMADAGATRKEIIDYVSAL